MKRRLPPANPGGGRINFPDWLPDWFYHELCAEVRNSDGWVKIANRNEAWDLLCYCVAVCIHPRLIGLENIEWDKPPSWAAEWDANDLVFMPEKDSKPFEKEPEVLDLSKLGAGLS